MKDIKGTKTEQNLINSFAGESQARNRYTFFAKKAKKEGYEQISQIFLDTAENEKEHAKLFYEYLGNIKGHVEADYPFELGTTEENLKSGVEGEFEEYDVLYKKGEEDAKAEGFDKIAETYARIREVEKHHSQRYAELLKQLKDNTLFAKSEPVKWVCRKCGYIMECREAPQKCPLCEHPQGYFEILSEKF